MRAITLIAMFGLAAGCHQTIRTRIPQVEATGCVASCDSNPNRSACLQACPGAVDEEGSCDDVYIPAGQVCIEREEPNQSGTITAVVAAVAVVVLLMVGVSYLDNNCPIC